MAAFKFLLKLGVGVIALWLIAAVCYAIFSSLSRSSTHWELQLHERSGSVAATLRKSTGVPQKTVVFEGVRSDTRSRSYRLPEQLGDLQGAQLEFFDTSVGPGRVRFSFLGHTFDIMERAVIIDGAEHSWDDTHVITLKTSNQAMQRTASKAATDVVRVCHPRFGCVARFRGLAVADLVSR